MSKITIHLDNRTDVLLKQWCDSTGFTRDEAVQAMVRMSPNYPGTSWQVTNRLDDHPVPRPAGNAHTITLDHKTGNRLQHWLHQPNTAAAIEAMIHVMVNHESIGDDVINHLGGQRVSGVPVRKAGPVPDAALPPQPPQPAQRPPTVPTTPQEPAPGSLGQAPSPGAPRAPRGPSPF